MTFNIFFLLIIFIFQIVLISCGPSENEKQIISRYSAKYSGFEIKPQGDYYLRVKIISDTVDTISLISMYENIILVKNQSGFETFRKDVPWKYLNVYNNKGEFLFRLGKDIYGSKEIFFKSKEFD